MYGLLTRTWWVVLVRGAAAAAFGATLLTRSHLPVALLALAFGAFAVVDGMLGVVMAIHGTRRDARSLLVESIAGTATGIVALGWPAATTGTALVLIAIWCGVRGLTQLWAAWRLHAQCPREVTLVAAACTALAACGVLVSHPTAATGLEQVTGATIVTAGALLMVLAARLWTWLRASHHIAAMVASPTVQHGRQRAV